MSPHSPLPPEFGDEPFLVGRALDLGVGKNRLGGRDLARPFRGVRVAGAPPASISELCRAYTARMPPTHVFSHVTAATLHGLPLPHWALADCRLHVTVPAAHRSPQMAGVVGHELCERLMDVELIDGLPLTTPRQTWIDLGPVLDRGSLIAVADFLCAGQHPRYTPGELRAAVAGLAGRRGIRGLREAALCSRARVDSAKETETRLLLLDSGVPEPVVNFEVTDTAGCFVARVDLAWPAWRVCVEYEGEQHRTDRSRFRSDITRRERLEDLGWRVIRITDDDLMHGGREFLRRVRVALAARGCLF
ncbi:DUF559 domain-containing protein [Cryobacterium sp. TMT1-21]|uniref:DUF559 domain-containing protein n=1 Tax=Cryobacterium shii TaxID=1259235 RepID=A0AAQ2HFA5_9MICO|nr:MULTISPECIES: DUF559 domain-containing protein [Cryobacterium]TFC46397.1 DUF559 domain-containing protein [Cryobacterium shii]TFC80735.1 DUF559 domain-containing protein [Cryobacterium sp. TmT2-59]TFD17319.1 DUF559 domain-containing protein [Cryobacterium sp. TMT1-21]TFD20339.1 DUF559 domain-containing protein [Cryobacterium sp. TMT2-23]TFD22356.1 DUF559 domain-containing protein [Cryobacterium sp. TMT4-10]